MIILLKLIHQARTWATKSTDLKAGPQESLNQNLVLNFCVSRNVRIHFCSSKFVTPWYLVIVTTEIPYTLKQNQSNFVWSYGGQTWMLFQFWSYGKFSAMCSLNNPLKSHLPSTLFLAMYYKPQILSYCKRNMHFTLSNYNINNVCFLRYFTPIF